MELEMTTGKICARIDGKVDNVCFVYRLTTVKKLCDHISSTHLAVRASKGDTVVSH